MKLKGSICFMVLAMVLWSCNNDDNGLDVEAAPLQTLAETVAENDTEINEFLQTHFYNYPDFNAPDEDFDYRVRIYKIAEADSLADSLKIPLADFVEKQTILLSSEDLGLDGTEIDVPHDLYYIKARSGEGRSPTVADSIYLRYEGSLTDGSVFDSRLGEPIWFDLLGTLTQSNPGSFVRGFELGLTNFESGGAIIDQPDGTFEVVGFGSGLIIMPSALGYFNGDNVGDPYEPLIFNIQLMVANEADHDNDGTPSIEEIEVDDRANITFTDSDGDGLPDYLDSDN